VDVGCENNADLMKTIRVGLHSLILVMADLAGIVGGALAAFRILGVPNQVQLQVPIAVVLSIGSFWAWVFSLRVLRLRRLQLVGDKELVACFAASILWAPPVFVSLHYFTQGYLSSLGNVVALTVYQFLVNGLALCAIWIFHYWNADHRTQQHAAPNGGPATQLGNSGVMEPPPSVS
jgi:hypothetical protein